MNEPETVIGKLIDDIALLKIDELDDKDIQPLFEAIAELFMGNAKALARRPADIETLEQEIYKVLREINSRSFTTAPLGLSTAAVAKVFRLHKGEDY